MRSAVLIHGKRPLESYNSNGTPMCDNDWFPGTQAALRAVGIDAITPVFPQAWQPNYTDWNRTFNNLHIDAETSLVGHSVGGGFLVRWLSEHRDVRVGKVLLVAPSLGKNWLNKEFFDFKIDPCLVERTAGVTIFDSTNDTPAIRQAVSELRTLLPNVKYREFINLGHFTLSSMGTDCFPELVCELNDNSHDFADNC